MIRHHESPAMEFSDTDAIAVVNITQLTEAHSMLPTAFYLCCQLDPDYLVNCCLRAESTAESFGSRDIVRCIKARQTLLQRALVDIVEIFDTVVPNHRCADAASECRSTLESTRQDRLTSPPPLLTDLLNRVERLTIYSKVLQSRLCRPCAEALCRVEEQQFRRNWQELPQLLGLPTMQVRRWPR